MALLTLTSTNPNLSYCIVKNPASGILAKEMRQGRVFGWFTPGNDSQYSIWFKDSDTDVSYKTHPDENFEYLNVTRYSSAMFVLNALTEFFSYTLKKPSEHDVAGFKHELVINLMYIKNLKYVSIFTSYFNDIKIVAEPLADSNYKVTVTTERTLKELVSFVNLFAMFNVIKNEQDYFDVSESTIDKYIACLQNVDAPYFVRYVFKVNLMRGKKSFDKYRPILETSGRYQKIDLAFGNSSMSRRDQVLKHVGFDRPIVDIGCGEGFYAHAFAKKLEGIQYHAVDKDPDCLDTVRHRAENKQIDNISTYTDIAELPEFDESIDVLAVEVIEHMPIEEAKKLMVSVLSTQMVRKLIITTPNVHFNVHYTQNDENDGMRHDDHHFELTPEEFSTFVLDVLEQVGETTGKVYEAVQSQIGDKVDGVGCSLMAVIVPQKADEAVVA